MKTSKHTLFFLTVFLLTVMTAHNVRAQSPSCDPAFKQYQFYVCQVGSINGSSECVDPKNTSQLLAPKKITIPNCRFEFTKVLPAGYDPYKTSIFSIGPEKIRDTIKNKYQVSHVINGETVYHPAFGLGHISTSRATIRMVTPQKMRQARGRLGTDDYIKQLRSKGNMFIAELSFNLEKSNTGVKRDAATEVDTVKILARKDGSSKLYEVSAHVSGDRNKDKKAAAPKPQRQATAKKQKRKLNLKSLFR